MRLLRWYHGHPIAGAYYNIGGPFRTVAILNALSFSPLKNDITVEVIPTGCGRSMPTCRCLTAKFEKHTGWKPEIPYEQTCATCSTTGANASLGKATAS